MRTKEVVEVIRGVDMGFERGEGRVLEEGSEGGCWLVGDWEAGQV